MSKHIDIRSINDRWKPRKLESLFSFHVTLELNLTPWTWDIYYYTSEIFPGDVQARLGPIGICVMRD